MENLGIMPRKMKPRTNVTKAYVNGSQLNELLALGKA
jgi:hypothetical protein